MIARIGTGLTLLSVFLFPWPFTAFLSLVTALFEPLVPVTAGLLIDTLYYIPHAGTLPMFTLSGALVTGLAFVVRSRIKTSIIEQ